MTSRLEQSGGLSQSSCERDTMRLLMYCGTASKGVLKDSGKRESGVRFQSIVSAHQSVLRANKDKIFGYLIWQERSTDPEEWGKIDIVPCLEVENACWVREVIPSIHSLNVGATPNLYSAELVRMFSQDGGAFPVDMFVNAESTTAQTVAFQMSTRSWYMPTVTRLENGVLAAGHDLAEPHKAPIVELVAAGRITTYQLYLTSHQKKMHAEMLRKVLQPSVTKKLLDRCIVLPNGIDTGYADDIVGRVEAPKDRSVGCFGAQNTDKAVDVIVEAYDRLFRSGKIDRGVFTATSPGTVAIPEWVENTYGLKREYLEKARTAKVIVSACRTEGFPIVSLEAMSVGCIVVQVDESYANGMFPEDYPFFFKTNDELCVKILAAIDRYEEWSPKVMKWVRDNFDEKMLGARNESWMRKIVEEHSPIFLMDREKILSKYSVAKEFLDVATRLGKKFKWSEFCSETKNIGRGRIGPFLCASEMVELLNKLGWKDSLREADPEFEHE